MCPHNSLALDARISLRMLPRKDTERRKRSPVPARPAHQRGQQRNFVAADKPARRAGKTVRKRKQTKSDG